MEYLTKEEVIKLGHPFPRRKPEGEALYEKFKELPIEAGIKILKEEWPYKSTPIVFLWNTTIYFRKDNKVTLRGFTTKDGWVVTKVPEDWKLKRRERE